MAPAAAKADTPSRMRPSRPQASLLSCFATLVAGVLAGAGARADAPAATAPAAPPRALSAPNDAGSASPAPAGAQQFAARFPPVPALDRVALARLRAGRVIADGEEDRDAASGAMRGWAICKCAVDAAWAVLTDHAKFPEFVPRVEKMEISRRTATGERAVQTIDASVSTLRYALDYTWDRATGTIEFHLVEEVPHDLKAVTGAWQLWPLDGGAATLFEYRSSVDAGRAIPGFIRSYLADRGVKDTLEAVRKRAEAIGAAAR